MPWLQTRTTDLKHRVAGSPSKPSQTRLAVSRIHMKVELSDACPSPLGLQKVMMKRPRSQNESSVTNRVRPILPGRQSRTVSTTRVTKIGLGMHSNSMVGPGDSPISGKSGSSVGTAEISGGSEGAGPCDSPSCREVWNMNEDDSAVEKKSIADKRAAAVRTFMVRCRGCNLR